MRTATLSRSPSTSGGTCGEWLSDSGFKCCTVERPWLDNQPDVSCIPEGSYLCLWQFSPKHGCNNYHLQGVPGRTSVEVHSANVAVQLEGCIAPGSTISPFGKDTISPGVPPDNCFGVTNSVATLAALEKDMRDAEGNQVSFTLEVKWA